MTACSFCNGVEPSSVLIEGTFCYFMDTGDPILVGGGMILPHAHRETVFDLTKEEWDETQSMLEQAKKMLDDKYTPDGYSVGWNCGTAAGQSHAHSHLHIIPRHSDEPFAGHGIRHHIKQPENKRPG